jgi:phospholipase C
VGSSPSAAAGPPAGPLDPTNAPLPNSKDDKEDPVTDEIVSPIQAPFSRRKLIGGSAAIAGGAALAAYLPASVLKAMDAGAATPFDPSQVKHIVYLMMENRSFDHYFGAMPGVAGFSDPKATTLPNGNTVFQQPDPDNPLGYLEPFHLDTTKNGSAAVPSLSHAWQVQHASLNGGANDGWIRAHQASDNDTSGAFTMGYYTGADIPFQWALAQAFTICDQYHCSVLGPTHPNRYVWQTGTVDPQGLAGGPALDNNAAAGTYSWTTPAEALTAAGYTWKCYQQSDNYGTNMYENMKQFVNAPKTSAMYQNAFSVSTLFGNGTPGGIGDPTNPTAATDPAHAFEEDCANGTLPDVSWLHTTSTASEHPSYLPAAGAQFVASILEALAANTELWNSTVFILNYDENDGFFDHVVPPSPSKAQYPEEFVHLPSPGGSPGGGLPVGGGFRVPCTLISPWTVNGGVYSDVLDHTSGLQFLEEVTKAGGLSNKGPITVSTISNWRRATFGNMLPAFQTTAAPAPSNTAFTASATAAQLTAQTTTSKLPLPAFPGRTQNVPTQG